MTGTAHVADGGAPASLRAPSVLVVDVDGVMTDGTFWYSEAGKVLKRFGPDDADALSIARHYLAVEFVSADERGSAINRRRVVDDMGYPLHLVPCAGRLQWMAHRHGLDRVVYIADGIFDAPTLRAVAYGIAPADADATARAAADYVTSRPGGRRAVAEACLHLLERFFGYDLSAFSGEQEATREGP